MGFYNAFEAPRRASFSSQKEIYQIFSMLIKDYGKPFQCHWQRRQTSRQWYFQRMCRKYRFVFKSKNVALIESLKLG